MLRKAEPATGKKTLTLDPSGQWCKKIKGRLYYFGRDYDAALAKYEAEREELESGIPTVAELVKVFLKAKEGLAPRTYRDYKAVCTKINKVAGAKRLSKLVARDFQAIHDAMSKCGPVRARNQLVYARMLFKFAHDADLIPVPLRYAFALKGPTDRQLRKAKTKRFFEAKEIRALIEAADQPLKSMIWLGINCGFGNRDCGLLTFEFLDLRRYYHNFPRPKTGAERRAYLWRETAESILEAVEGRKEGPVFLTKYGNPFADDHGNSITHEFGKLEDSLKMPRRGFYTLRRTFQTVAEMAGGGAAVPFIMGHVPDSSDMSARYRQDIFDTALLRVSTYVRNWVLGKRLLR